MTEPQHRVEGASDVVRHPVESTKAIAADAEGGSGRAPGLALSGVTIVVSIAFAIVLIAVVIAYVVA
jgi:hypothetical protein